MNTSTFFVMLFVVAIVGRESGVTASVRAIGENCVRGQCTFRNGGGLLAFSRGFKRDFACF